MPIQSITYETLPGLRLSNTHLALTLLPDPGGKIVSLVHKDSRREWLWRNLRLPLRRPDYDAPYATQADFGGLDECFPTVGACHYPSAPWQGIPVPDHGELFAQPWVVEILNEGEETSIHMGCYGVRFPYCFERTLTLHADRPGLQLKYRVTNLSPFAFPFLWSIHPLLRLEPGMRLSLPKGVETVWIEFSSHDFFGAKGTQQPWPIARTARGEPFDLSTIPPAWVELAVKYFTQPLSGNEPVETALETRDGHGLRFRFDPRSVTHVGIWMNCGGWAGTNGEPYYNIGFEPCIGGTDALEAAVNDLNSYGWLGPREVKEWALEVDIF